MERLVADPHWPLRCMARPSVLHDRLWMVVDEEPRAAPRAIFANSHSSMSNRDCGSNRNPTARDHDVSADLMALEQTR